jgi:hypothetical protein
MKNGESAEFAIVGNEGVIGIALFMDGESTQSRAIVPASATKSSKRKATASCHFQLKYASKRMT